jgi:hypothetical protein
MHTSTVFFVRKIFEFVRLPSVRSIDVLASLLRPCSVTTTKKKMSADDAGETSARGQTTTSISAAPVSAKTLLKTKSTASAGAIELPAVASHHNESVAGTPIPASYPSTNPATLPCASSYITDLISTDFIFEQYLNFMPNSRAGASLDRRRNHTRSIGQHRCPACSHRRSASQRRGWVDSNPIRPHLSPFVCH